MVKLTTFCSNSPLMLRSSSSSRSLHFPHFNHTKPLHTTTTLHWKLRYEYKLNQSQLLDRICRILLLQCPTLITRLHFNYSDELLNSVLRKLKFHPSACLGFFNLASKQQTIRPNISSYSMINHILSKARIFDQAKTYLDEFVGYHKTEDLESFVFNELNPKVVARSSLDLHKRCIDFIKRVQCYQKGVRMWANAETVGRVTHEKNLKKQPGWSYIEVRGKLHGFVARDGSHSGVREIYEMLGCLHRNLAEELG